MLSLRALLVLAVLLMEKPMSGQSLTCYVTSCAPHRSCYDRVVTCGGSCALRYEADEDDAPVKWCARSVQRTGEVTEQIDEDRDGDFDLIVTHYCNTDLCNTASSIVANMLPMLLLTYALQ